MSHDLVQLERLISEWGRAVEIEDELAALGGLSAGDGDWVALAEAEEASGVSRSTLRAWYRAGRIPSRLMPGPNGLQRLVPLGTVMELARQMPRRSGRTETVKEEAPVEPATTDVILRLAELASSAAEARAAAAEARAAAAEVALHAALERAAAAEAELRLLRP